LGNLENVEKVYIKYLKGAWSYLKPWIGAAALLLILRYTGLLSGISYLTGRALMYTGIMDASVSQPAVINSFDYNFTIRDLEGRERSFNEFRNKTIFLNVWATWCGPCRMEMPGIQGLYQETDTTKVVFVMLSVDKASDLGKVRTYVKDKAFTFPVYVPAGPLPAQLDVPSIPTTFVIGPDGRIASSQAGATNYNTRKFKRFLNSLSAGKAN
jgi:thiol-disulfide isomerase/thioredoxin